MTRMLPMEMHTGRLEHDKWYGIALLTYILPLLKQNYRSPWTNEYVPQLPDGTKPSSRLRVLEEAANEAFSIYREMYYEGTGISSVYLWDLEDPNSSSAIAGSGSFAGVVLLKKTTSGATSKSGEGSWDSIHVFEVNERSRTGNYKLTSTVSVYKTPDVR